MSVAIAAQRELPTTADACDRDPDRALVEALRRREPTAADRLVSTYGHRAYRLAAGITSNEQDAEEVAQDACWSVVRNIDAFRGAATFGSWFYRIVANGAYAKMRQRHSRRRDLSLDEILPAFDDDGRHAVPVTDWSSRVDDPALQAELREVLTAALAALPESYRTALLLRDVEGLAPTEIAHVLGVTVPAAKTRVHRARLFLRKRLGDRLSPNGQTAA